MPTLSLIQEKGMLNILYTLFTHFAVEKVLGLFLLFVLITFSFFCEEGVYGAMRCLQSHSVSAGAAEEEEEGLGVLHWDEAH